jgi:hypothetical protein
VGSCGQAEGFANEGSWGKAEISACGRAGSLGREGALAAVDNFSRMTAFRAGVIVVRATFWTAADVD